MKHAVFSDEATAAQCADILHRAHDAAMSIDPETPERHREITVRWDVPRELVAGPHAGMWIISLDELIEPRNPRCRFVVPLRAEVVHGAYMRMDKRGIENAAEQARDKMLAKLPEHVDWVAYAFALLDEAGLTEGTSEQVARGQAAYFRVDLALSWLPDPS